jgi:uncharacterized RDD family membrane protein YckC
MRDPQTTLLRLTAFLVDSLSLAVALMVPSSVVSYLVVWLGGGLAAVNIVWSVAVVTLGLILLLRDGYGGRSLGKRILGLRLMTESGAPCGYGRSVVRNLPLVIPVWNLIDAALVIAGRPRTGDRMARTTVAEE